MKKLRMRLLTISAIGLIAVSTGAGRAAAQSAGGSFTLPCEVKWQGTELPAGDYTFTLRTASMPAIVNLNGPDGRVFVMASAINEDRINRPTQSWITLDQRSGMSVVSEMYLADLGLHIFYNKKPAIPKNEQKLAQGPASNERVLIAMAKK